MQPTESREPRWHAAIAVLAALALYVTLPPKLIIGPLWLLPLLVLLILVPLMILAPRRHLEAPWQRVMSITQIALLNAFNVATVATLFVQLLSEHHRKNFSGEALLYAAVQIWFTNIIVYSLWYWEIDGRGPDMRSRTPEEQMPKRSDFLFPQIAMNMQRQEQLHWKPRFLDYVFLAFSTATAFSPADTVPVTPLAKVLMMAEALISLVTIALIAGRAINILGT
jgi:hypothetical protein